MVQVRIQKMKPIIRLLPILIWINLIMTFTQLQAFHAHHHTRWHSSSDGSSHVYPNHWTSTLSSDHHHQHKLKIPIKPRNQLLSSHPPIHLLDHRSSRCSMMRKLSGRCESSTYPQELQSLSKSESSSFTNSGST